MLVPEMIQEDCEPQKLAEQLLPHLGDDEKWVRLQYFNSTFLAELHKLIQCDADSQAATSCD